MCPCLGPLIFRFLTWFFDLNYYFNKSVCLVIDKKIFQVAVFSTLLAIAAAAPDAEADAAVISPYAGYAGYAGLGYAGYAGAYAGS